MRSTTNLSRISFGLAHMFHLLRSRCQSMSISLQLRRLRSDGKFRAWHWSVCQSFCTLSARCCSAGDCEISCILATPILCTSDTVKSIPYRSLAKSLHVPSFRKRNMGFFMRSKQKRDTRSHCMIQRHHSALAKARESCMTLIKTDANYVLCCTG